MTFSLKGRTAIVTGASTGVGLAVAQKFSDEGANIVLHDYEEQSLKAALSHFDENQENICIVAGDLRERLCVSNLLAACLEKFGQIDILVNATRVIEKTDAFETDNKAISALVDKNAMTNLSLSKAVIRQMCEQNMTNANGEKKITRGAIVNMSSIFAHLIRPEFMGYSIAASMIESITRAMAVAYADKKIRVNAIAYGSIMGRNLLSMFNKNKSLKDNIERVTPLGRIASASEVAFAAQFLASDASQFMTGQVLMVDGGRTLNDSLPTSLF